MACCNIDIKINPFTTCPTLRLFLVKLRNGKFKMVMPVGKEGTLILCGSPSEPWFYLSSWDDEFNAKSSRFYGGEMLITREEYTRGHDIVAVYGYVRGSLAYSRSGVLSEENRELLWERKIPKKMTVEEISNILGYEVEIVAG